MELTSLDLSILMKEFEQLEEGHVQKVYQRKDELTIEIYVPGDEKKRLIIGTDKAFLSNYKRDNPTKPPGFCMELRKHLGRVDSINQRGFDRILEIKSGETKLICEIFGKGNFILTKNEKIIGCLREKDWADRTIRVGEKYKYPSPATDPYKIEDYFSEFSEDEEIVRQIASKLSFGGTYAEEVCNRCNIEKNKEIKDLTNEERKAITQAVKEVLNRDNFSPKLYSEDEEPVRASPFELEKYSEYPYEEFDAFSRAIDEFYYRKKQLKEKKKKEKKFNELKNGIERKKQQQERKIEGLQKSSEINRERAEKIYENYQTLNKAKNLVEKSIDKHGWDKTQEKIKESEKKLAKNINNIDKQNETFSISLSDTKFNISLYQDLEATASGYYDKAKDSEDKIESVENALEKTKEELEDLEKDQIEVEKDTMEDKTKKRKKKWFEKYRWFRSSEDYLVLIGRDAQTNDMLVKKHMENNDLYFHADFDGAPSVVVKKGQEAGEQTLREAAKAAVTFAKTWKAGIGADDVYYVDPEQVTQNPESGEYLSKGAFVIRGNREYIRNVSVEAAIGSFKIEEDLYVPICGPETAVEEHCEQMVEIKPGNIKKSELAKEINKRLDQDLDLDYIIRSLPPGKSSVKN